MDAMDGKYKRLLSPGKINRLQLKNRIVMPPMGYGFHVPSGVDTDKEIEVYARRARGGAAMFICGPYFTPKQGKEHPHYVPRVHLGSPYADQNPRLHFLVEAVKVNGGLICASLSPTPLAWAGSQVHVDESVGVGQWEETILSGLGVYNRMSTAEIEDNIAEFAGAANQVKRIGFDALEINYSYFPDYFTIEMFNQRKDKYGGDLEGRLRYHKELLEATRAVVGANFPIMTMWDIDSFRPGWRTLDDSKVMARKLEAWGADSIRTRSGNSMNVEYDIMTQYFPKGHTAYLAAALKEAVRIPLIANGKLSDPDLAERILEDGRADFISIGRGLLADPDLPNKVRADKLDRIRKCIYCCQGCYGNHVRFPDRGSRCTVNPLFGNEEKFRDGVPPARTKKKVVIVGAGPAGMSAALTAGQRGHDVVLLERTGGLGAGGQFALSCIPPSKQENLHIPVYYVREFKELVNIKVRFNTEANKAVVMAERPDAVIIATGASSLTPEIPGATGPGVLNYDEVLLEKKQVGSRVVIIGGGQVGCETGHYLIAKGKKVTILEMLPRLADEVNPATRNSLMKELTEGGAAMMPGARVTSVDRGRVHYTKDGSEASVEGDTIVLCVGARPENHLYEDLRDHVLDLHIIGDAKEPRTVLDAVAEGFYASYYI